MSSIKPTSSTSPLSQTVSPNTTSNLLDKNNLTKTQLDDLNYELSSVNCNCPNGNISISGDCMQEKYKKNGICQESDSVDTCNAKLVSKCMKADNFKFCLANITNDLCSNESNKVTIDDLILFKNYSENPNLTCKCNPNEATDMCLIRHLVEKKICNSNDTKDVCTKRVQTKWNVQPGSNIPLKTFISMLKDSCSPNPSNPDPPAVSKPAPSTVSSTVTPAVSKPAPSTVSSTVTPIVAQPATTNNIDKSNYISFGSLGGANIEMVCPIGYYREPDTIINGQSKLTNCIGPANISYSTSGNTWNSSNNVSCQWGRPVTNSGGNTICLYQY